MMKIGIDSGSKFLKIVRMDSSGTLVPELYIEHHGNPEQTAVEYFKNMGPESRISARLTGSCADRIMEAFSGAAGAGMEPAEEISAVIAAAEHFECRGRYIVNVGAGSITCVTLDDLGNFRSYRENSLCAAGTGSFLDEQMRRMGFGYDMLSTLGNTAEPPDIATRCAVFAKSDLIHRQQEGYTKEEMWSGLCRGVVSTMLSTLFRGNVPDEEILFCGGMFQNVQVRHWVRSAVARPVFHDLGHFFPAFGALLISPGGAGKSHRLCVTRELSECGIEEPVPEKAEPANKAHGGKGGDEKTAERHLTLRLSTHPDFSTLREYIRDGNEVRIHREVAPGTAAALGVDIGSTSTKCVLIDAESHEVLFDIYRKTGGDPLGASKALFSELRSLLEGKNVSIHRGATTGSGRRLVGEIMGADLIVNEITAHFSGASRLQPDIETIFEIGGQDSKYIRGSGGAVVDSAMNYVCAAGTGSFIEEQAGRLGFDVRDIGDITLGKRIPHTSDRCTVFMEQDINKLLREGYSREEALAGVLHSIAKNYLHRVVGTRPVTGRKIFFQGATARNKALVAAFELILDREIVVSPYCHVMGALGGALLACERVAGEGRFRGLDVFERPIGLEYRQCTDCANKCTITLARLESGEELAWGFMCGREGFSAPRKKNRGENHMKRVEALAYARDVEGTNIDSRLQNRRGVKIGIPVTLSMYNYLPLWRTFLEHLGFEVVLSGKTTQAHKESGTRISLSDFCFPVKVALAHIHNVSAMDVDAMFFPSVISEKKQGNNLPRMFCPYVISYASLSKHAGLLPVPVISPNIDFRTSVKIALHELHRVFSAYGVSMREVRDAYAAGRRALERFLVNRHEYGRRLVEKITGEDRKAVVFIGRPYNLYDGMINLHLPERFREYGVEILPYECLMEPEHGESDVQHMYWHYGERILSLAGKIRDMEGVYPVYFTNFGCGPDSFILSRFEKTMQGKPYLIIELDEHGSETGYLTRIEAFMDVVTSAAGRSRTAGESRQRFHATWNRIGKKLWIPPMHEISGRLTAAGFRAFGYDAEALPAEGTADLEAGRQGVRGSECLPAHTTIGVFLNKLRAIDARPEEHALFMPTAEGPCRFGQYVMLHRAILDKFGYEKTAIFSSSSVNSYMGMPTSLRSYLWDIFISGDMLMKYICKIRPYEKNPGEVDSRFEEIFSSMEKRVEKRENIITLTEEAMAALSKISLSGERKPLVGIVGEIYVRCNPFCNNHLIRSIESYGGEAWLSPVMEWVLYTGWMERYFAKLHRRSPLHKSLVHMKTSYLFSRVHKFEKALHAYLHDRVEPPVERVIGIAREMLPLIFEGEAILTAGRAVAFLEDGADMVVNAAPFGCMPGNITHALFHRIQEEQGRPILTLFYDGQSDINRNVGVYLKNLGKNRDVKRDDPVSA